MKRIQAHRNASIVRYFITIFCMMNYTAFMHGSLELNAQQVQLSKNKKQRYSIADAYETLGLLCNATDEDIKHTYRDLLLQHHPDKNLTNKEAATLKYLENAKAYDFICEHKKWRNEAVDATNEKIKEEIQQLLANPRALARAKSQHPDEYRYFESFLQVLQHPHTVKDGRDVRLAEAKKDLDSLYKHLGLLNIKTYDCFAAATFIPPFREVEAPGTRLAPSTTGKILITENGQITTEVATKPSSLLHVSNTTQSRSQQTTIADVASVANMILAIKISGDDEYDPTRTVDDTSYPQRTVFGSVTSLVGLLIKTLDKNN